MPKKQFLVCLIAILGFLHMGSVSAATLDFIPSISNVNVNDAFDVDVVISDLGSDLVGGFDISIDYDPAVLSATGVQFSDSLGDPDPLFFETITFSDTLIAGTVNAFNSSLLSTSELAALQPSGGFTILTLSFLADAIGTSALEFGFSLISDDGGIAISTSNQTGQVNVVPLPGAVWLMITALMGIGAMARKRAAA
jgi:hypothetical protein